MDVSCDAFLLHELLQYERVGGGNFLAVKPFYTRIFNSLGNGQRESALGESQTVDDVSIFIALNEFVLAHDTNVGHTTSYALWNIIIAQVEHFYGKIG